MALSRRGRHRIDSTEDADANTELMRTSLMIGLPGAILGAVSCVFFLSVFGQLVRGQANLMHTSTFE